MNAVYDMMTLEFWPSLLRVLAHTLWQGLAIALVLYGLLKGISVKRTEWRYGLAFTALLLVVVSALVTWSVQHLPESPSVSSVEVGRVPDIVDKYAVSSNPTGSVQEIVVSSPQGLKQVWPA